MDNIYVKELFHKLEHTEIWNGSREKYPDYNSGIRELICLFRNCKKNRAQVFFIGNGGSSAIASHMTVDFMKNGGMKTYNLQNPSVITCMGNDYGYESVFSKTIEFLAESGDLLVAVSSSGNSPNIIQAIKEAEKKKAYVVTFTGFRRDNQIRHMGDINIYVPCEKYGIVESIHNLILQQIVDEIMEQDGVEF